MAHSFQNRLWVIASTMRRGRDRVAPLPRRRRAGTCAPLWSLGRRISTGAADRRCFKLLELRNQIPRALIGIDRSYGDTGVDEALEPGHAGLHQPERGHGRTPVTARSPARFPKSHRYRPGPRCSVRRAILQPPSLQVDSGPEGISAKIFSTTSVA